MAGQNGGRRPGAGRKPLSKTVKRVSPEVINAGILPLEMRLRVSRKMWAEACDEAGEITDLDKAKAAADFALPAMAFTSPSLKAVEHSGPNGGPIDHRILSAKESLAGKLARIRQGKGA
jgi:hypothetical protein